MNDAFSIFNQDERKAIKFNLEWCLVKDNPK